MDTKQRLENISKDFYLDFNFELNYLTLTNREIIIRNFVGDCPDTIYLDCKRRHKNNLTNALNEYLNSNDYEKEVLISQACMISKKELKKELKLINKISEIKLKGEVGNIYQKIEEKIGDKKRLTLVWKLSKSEKNSERRNEIILHEFVHELLENNKIRPKSWKWNEGLVTYITYREIDKLYRIKKSSKNYRYSEMWDIYAIYAGKWMKILEKVKEPKKRKELIINKSKKVDQ